MAAAVSNWSKILSIFGLSVFCFLSAEGSARISHHNRHRVPARRLLLDVVHKGSNSLQVVPSYDAYEFLSKQYGFTCQDKKSGYYGDFLYECRIFHVCHSDGRRDTFFCPALTRFNDVLQICDWQHKIDQHCRPLYAIPTDTSYDGKETYLLPSIQALFRPDDLHPYSANFKPSHQLHHATEKPYRNKYQEQEYYQSVYSQQQEPRLKFLLETQVPGPFAASRHPHIRFVPKQAFIENRPDIQAPAAEVNVLIAHGSGSLLPNDRSPAHEDDSGSVRAATETDVDVETPDHQEEKADDSPVPESKYDGRDLTVLGSPIRIPPPVNDVVDERSLLLQTPAGPVAGQVDGKRGGAAGGGVGAAESGQHQQEGGAGVGTAAGGPHQAEVDALGLNGFLTKEFEDGPVIELWIPTRVKNLS